MATDGPLFTQDEVEYQMTHINENRGPEILASAIVLAVLAMVAVVLRLTCRRYTKCAISWDEYTILAGLVRHRALCFMAVKLRLLTLKALLTELVLLSRL